MYTHNTTLIILFLINGIFANALNNSPSFSNEELAPTKLVYENCGEAFFIFERADLQNRDDDLVINFTIAATSTAVVGDDFESFPNTITIPKGAASFKLPINIIEDNIEEVTEKLIIEVQGNCACVLPFDEIRISELQNLVVNIDNQTICLGNQLVLNPSIDGGLAPYTYSWNSGESTRNISNFPNADADFILTVSDACGKEAMATASVEVLVLPTAILQAASNICTGNSSVSTPVELTGTGPWELQYSLDGNLQTTITGITESPYNFEMSTAGSYQLESVTASAGCVGTVTGSVQLNMIDFSTSFQDTKVTCFGDQDGAFDLEVMGGTAPYTYQWSGGLAATQDQNNIAAGNYTLTITDANSCTLISSASVGTPAELDASTIRLRGADCDLSTSSIDLTVKGGTAPYNYQWSHIVDDIQDPTTVSVGSFNVTVTDANSCITNSNITVNTPTAIQLQILGTSSANCADMAGGSIDLEVTGGIAPYTYNWDNGVPNTQDPSGLIDGNYAVNVVDAIGCENNISATVEIDTIFPVATSLADVILICPNTGLQLDGAGSSLAANFTYVWTSLDGFAITDEMTLFPNVFDPGRFELVVTDNDNGCTANTNVTVHLGADTPYVIVNPTDTVTCFVPEIELSGANSNIGTNAQFEWTSWNGTLVDATDEVTAQAESGGIYTLTITNPANGCFDSDSIRVAQNITPPKADGGNNTALTCHILEVDLGGTNSSVGDQYLYNWSSEDVLLDGVTNVDSIKVQEAGLFLFTVTDMGNGCSTIDEVLVIDNTPSDIIIAASPPVCYEEKGAIEILDIVGGIGPYFYSIDGGEIFTTVQFHNNLEEGQYIVIAQDEEGCQVMETVDITGKDEIIVDLDPKITLSFGEEFMFNTITNLQAFEIDTIIWTPAEFLSCNDCLTPVITPTLSGSYVVKIIDLNGCEASTTVDLTVSKDYQIYIPNVFSPYREDGFNDVFYINARGNIIQNIKTFRIVDRWGNLVFENKDFQANDPSQGWDGFFLGKKLNADVFIYYAEIEFIDGETELYTGDVLILD